jgi:beta-glucosidase
VSNVAPVDGALAYEEGVFIGYRAWERAPVPPAFWFGHGHGYTSWTYESAEFTPGGGELGVLRVRVRNDGARPGREVVQAYLAPLEPDPGSPRNRGDGVRISWGGDPDRPRRWLAGFATISAAPGETAEVEIVVQRRAAETWDVSAGAWRLRTGGYAIETGRSVADRRLVTPIEVTEPAGTAGTRP